MPDRKQIVHTGFLQHDTASGVRCGDLLFISGQVSLDEDGDVVGGGNIEEQTRHCYRNLRKVLDKIGAKADSIVDETWYVLDMQDTLLHSDDLTAVREEILGKSLKSVSHTLVEVTGLVYPELLIEIKCIAHL